jgi:hypothetical protein
MFRAHLDFVLEFGLNRLNVAWSTTNSTEARPTVMNKSGRRVSPLAEVELETLEEGREWTRRRLERKLQRLADAQGAISPPEQSGAEGGEKPETADPNDGG